MNKITPKNIVLSGRDFDYFEDIKRFGFTTTEHYSIRFNTCLSQARNRISLLTKNHFLKNIGQSKWSNRKFYIPDHKFFRLCPTKNICRMNIFSAEHDEYLLILYSLLTSKRIGKKIVLEQDFKKNDLQKKDHRIPDLIVENESKNFIIEYEKSLKNKNKYEEMHFALSRYAEEKTSFIFICFNQKIALEIEKNIELKNIFLIKPEKFLKILKENNYKEFHDYLNHDDLFYI